MANRLWPCTAFAAGLFMMAAESAAQTRERMPIDREEPPALTHRLGEHWWYGGAVQLDAVMEHNFDLDSRTHDDLASFEPRLEMAITYAPRSGFRFHVEGELSRGFYLRREIDTPDPRTKARLRQAYVALAEPWPGVSLQLGRQRFKDKREWWYNEDLDAARVFYRTGRLGLELSASRNPAVAVDLLNRERSERSSNYMAVGRYAYRNDAEFAAYLIAQNRTDAEEEPVFLGLRSIGRLGPRLEHWIDAALVRGKDDGRDIRAWGWDAGLEYQLDAPLRPSLLLGVAFGSGDAKPDDSKNTEFRQTGLQASYFYYGEVLGPELSNMWIYTAGIELRPVDKASVRFLYHAYRQHRADDRLRDVLVEPDPDGRSRNLGQAVDMVASYEGIPDLHFDFIVGSFFPGPAFEQRDHAWFTQILVTYEFW